VVPGLDILYSLLTNTAKDTQEKALNMPGGATYHQWLVRVGAALPKNLADDPKNRPLLDSPEVQIAVQKLNESYWSQPPDQLGGVAGTLDTYLKPFTEPAIAEVFCRDCTVNFTDVTMGKVITVSIPQRYALQRVYINTIISQIIYQIIQNRFDENKGTSRTWDSRNVVRQEKDEPSVSPSTPTLSRYHPRSSRLDGSGLAIQRRPHPPFRWPGKGYRATLQSPKPLHLSRSHTDVRRGVGQVDCARRVRGNLFVRAVVGG
jgi:hypothetical protein